MNHVQKQAWFLLVAFAVNLIAGAVLMALLPVNDPANTEFLGVGVYQIRGYGIWQAAFLVAIVLGEYLFRKRPGDVFDERDQQICQAAKGWATTIFWLAFGAVCAGLIFVLAPQQIAFPAVWVVGPLIVGGLVVYQAAYSVAIITLYRRGGSHE